MTDKNIDVDALMTPNEAKVNSLVQHYRALTGKERLAQFDRLNAACGHTQVIDGHVTIGDDHILHALAKQNPHQTAGIFRRIAEQVTGLENGGPGSLSDEVILQAQLPKIATMCAAARKLNGTSI